MAAWRIGAIYQPLFTAFEAKSIDHRITTAQTKLIVANDEQRPKLNTLNVPVIVTVHQTGLYLSMTLIFGNLYNAILSNVSQ